MGQVLQQVRNVMQLWLFVFKELIFLFYLFLLYLEEDKIIVSQEFWYIEILVFCCFDLLKKLRVKFQSFKVEREEVRYREEMVFRGKDVVEIVLEVFCVYVSQCISQLEQDLVFMQEFRGFLKDIQI